MLTANQTNMKTKATLKPQVPDFCPACDAVDHPFKPIHRKVQQEFRGETLEVDAPAMSCCHCGFVILAPGNLDTLRLATANAYRQRHGLLTSEEIIWRRVAMGMSQRDFAEYVGMGVASLQRWENGLIVQDKGSDLLIRERTKHTLFISSEATPSKDRVTVVRGNFSFLPNAIWNNQHRSTHHRAATIHHNPLKNDWSHALAATA